MIRDSLDIPCNACEVKCRDLETICGIGMNGGVALRCKATTSRRIVPVR